MDTRVRGHSDVEAWEALVAKVASEWHGLKHPTLDIAAWEPTLVQMMAERRELIDTGR